MEEGKGKEEKVREGRDREITAHCQKRRPEITAVNGAASGRAAGRNLNHCSYPGGKIGNSAYHAYST